MTISILRAPVVLALVLPTVSLTFACELAVPFDRSLVRQVDGGDAGREGGSDGAADARSDVRHVDSHAPDAKASPLAIVTSNGDPLATVSGGALRLTVVTANNDGGTQPLPDGAIVTWTVPATIVAQDPLDAGPNGVLPAPGPHATGFFATNPYRPDRLDYPGTLFVSDPGAGDGGALTVTATVGDAGAVSATVTVSPLPPGSVDAGASLYQSHCAVCHGATGDGTPPSDGGEAGTVYVLNGQPFSYPAPGLNNTSPGGSPNLAADPDWNASLLAVASQSDMDNSGVALRSPMVDWLGILHAQDFADIYAYLQTQQQ